VPAVLDDGVEDAEEQEELGAGTDGQVDVGASGQRRLPRVGGDDLGALGLAGEGEVLGMG
jgi:hypothetical protein